MLGIFSVVSSRRINYKPHPPSDAFLNYELREEKTQTRSHFQTSAEQGNAEQTAAQNDSISIWFRKESDAYLANQLLSSFNQRDDRIALFPVEVAEVQRIFEAAVENNTSESSLRDRFYLAGDHFSFWSISNRNFSSFSLPTVFLTTMGNSFISLIRFDKIQSD